MIRRSGGIPPFAFLLVAIFLSASQFLQDKANVFFLDRLYSDPEEQKQGMWLPSSHAKPETLRARLLEKQHEVEELKRSLRFARVIHKDFGEDLKLMPVEVVRHQWRQTGHLAVVDVGRSEARVGDLLVHDGSVCGELTYVSSLTSLVAELTAPQVQKFVRIEGLDGCFRWEGHGHGVAWVQVHRMAGSARDLIGKLVYLDLPKSRGGHFVAGEIVSVRPAANGGWWQLEAKGRVIPKKARLFVVQPLDIKTNPASVNSRIEDLRNRIEVEKLSKLHMELLQP